MADSITYSFLIYQNGLIFLALFGLSIEVSYRWGRKRHTQQKDKLIPELIPTTILGLLALLLGFTFSMSIARFDARKTLVIDEANAIGTAFLRTSILPKELGDRSRELLRDYTAERVRFFDQLRDPETRNAFLKKTDEIHNELWSLAMQNGASDRSALSSIYVQSLNEVFDIDAKRIFASRDRVPDAVYLTILITAVLGLSSLSLLLGGQGRGHRSLLMWALMFTLIILLIQDLDRPGIGLIRVDTSSLQDLHVKLTEAP